MTKEELENNHLHVPENHTFSRSEHAKISIEYAIGVLEEVDSSCLELLKSAKRNVSDTDQDAEVAWSQTNWHHVFVDKLKALKAQLI